jgi:hypothetical protein
VWFDDNWSQKTQAQAWALAWRSTTRLQLQRSAVTGRPAG